MRMRRIVVLALLAVLALAPSAGAAQRCDFRGSTTLASNAEARIFSVKGRGAGRRVYFGCRRDRRPVLLSADASGTTSDTFRLAGAWVVFRRTDRDDGPAGEDRRVLVVRSLAGDRAPVEQDVSRYVLRRLVLAPDGAVAWVLADGVLREVGGIAPGASVATPLAVAPGIDSRSLLLSGRTVRFRVGGEARRATLAAPPAPPTGNRVGAQGLDGRFGDCGTLVPASPRPGPSTEAAQLARTSGGALVVAGATSSSGAEQPDTFVVSRFSRAGRFDSAFGRAGVAQVDVPRAAGALGVTLAETVVAPDGRVLLAGHVRRPDGASSVVVRLTPAGALDLTFGDDGIVRDPVPAETELRVEDLALLPGGAMLVAGRRDGRWFVARLQADGALDETFGERGVVEDTGEDPSRLETITVQAGTVFAAGGTGRPLLVRLTADDGALLSVSSEGPPAAVVLESLEPTPGGGVVASGTGANVRSADQLVLARYGADGRPDVGFGTSGFVLDPQIGGPRDVALAPDGSILVTAPFTLDPGGYAGDGLVRYAPGGTRDVGFGFRGALGGTSTFGLAHHDVLVEEDGTALVAQDNGGAFAVSRFAVSGPALVEAGTRSTVCAMATATRIGPLVKSGRIDVSLRLRAPGTVRLDAVVRAGGRDIPAGTATVFRPYTEGAVASIRLTRRALTALRATDAARLTLSGGAPGGARTAHRVALVR